MTGEESLKEEGRIAFNEYVRELGDYTFGEESMVKMFVLGAIYADKHPRKGLVDIDKIASFIKYHAQEFVYISAHSGEAKINEFKLVEVMYKAMEE